MPKLSLSHFEASLLLALAISTVLGVVTRKMTAGEGGVKRVEDATDRDRLNYFLYCMGCFLLAIFGLGWLMYLGHR